MDLIITILPVVTKDLPISPRFTPYNFFIAMQVQRSYNSSTNGWIYTFENKKYICGTTSVPIGSLHKAPETSARGLRRQAWKGGPSTRQSGAPQDACV